MAKSKGRLIGAIVVSSLIFILALVMAFDALRAYLIKKGRARIRASPCDYIDYQSSQ